TLFIDDKLPMVVLDIHKEGALRKVVMGEKIGSLITEGDKLNG
ncbi:hypothetical protein OMAG_001716, partial [Candidatus Omnitrophus magneticus]